MQQSLLPPPASPTTSCITECSCPAWGPGCSPGCTTCVLSPLSVFPKYLCFTLCCSKYRPLVIRDHKMMGEFELSFAWTNLLTVPRLALGGQGRGTEAGCRCPRGPWLFGTKHNSINVHHRHRAVRQGGGSGPYAERVLPLQN